MIFTYTGNKKNKKQKKLAVITTIYATWKKNI